MVKCKKNEKAQVYVHDLDLFVTVQILDDTLAVLSLGKLCEEHGYTYEWASGHKPHQTKQGEDGFRVMRKISYLLLCLDCRPTLVPARPLHRHRRTRQVHLQVQQQSDVTIWHRKLARFTKNSKQKYKEGQQSRLGRPFARLSGMVRGVHRKSRRYRSACQPHTFLMTQIRNVLQKWHPGSTVFILTSTKDRNCEVCLRTCQKTHWRSSPSSREVW